VVLHDLVLQHLFLGLSVERANVQLYVSEMKRAYGERGAALGRQIAAALGSGELIRSKFPLCERLVERSYGVLVLTRYMQQWLRKRFGAVPVGKFIGRAPHHFAPPPPLAASTPSEARKILELSKDELIVSSFGLVTHTKRIDRALEGFRLFARRHPKSRFIIVGEVQKGFPIEQMKSLPELKGKITVTGHLPMDRFYLYLLASDVVVNLRFPSTGELSGTLIRALGMGKPVLVSNTGFFAEFPEYTVARIDLGPPEVEEIADTLALFARSPDLREAMGRFAREYVEETYSLKAEAEAYLDFLNEVAQAVRKGTLAPPPPYDQADLAASIMASISDLPLGSTFGLETVREALRSASEEGSA
jgi:glycosyltransferase involved in cell wall biosynthesis